MNNNTLIPIFDGEISGESVQLVDARLLHAFLGSAQDFSTWIKRRIKEFDFIQNVDFIVPPKNGALKSKAYGQDRIEYYLTIDMAKELSMVERSEKGKQARKYFIECERIALSLLKKPLQPEPIIALAPTFIDLQVAELAARMLRMSDTSKTRMLTIICENHNVSPRFLPSYSDEQLTMALGDLLKKHGALLSAVKTNPILESMGLLEKLERRSAKGEKKTFWSITEAGLVFGKNETSMQSPNETQPRWYVGKFPELLQSINDWLADDSEAA